ncbi:MAG: hypothetical protein V1664_00195 [Candidatus Uhrbacteria bacterium]
MLYFRHLMKKKVVIISVLIVIIIGFLIPYFFSPKLSTEYKQGISSALEPFGVFYPGVKYSNEKITANRCADRGLQQVLLQTSSWMFIPGPLVELCVYPEDLEAVKSAGTVDR